MLKLCAPVRDENIKALSEITDVVETFKAIFEVFFLIFIIPLMLVVFLNRFYL